MMQQRSIVVTLVSLALVAVGGPPASRASGAEAGSLAFLLELPGELVGVRYSPGSLERAVHLQDRYTLLLEDFRSWSNSPVALVLFLLSRDEWQQAGFELPYGVPTAMGGRGLAMSAWGDAQTVQLWKDLLGSRLPILPDTPLRGSPDEVASQALAALLGAVEVSYILLQAGGYRGDRPWVDGVMAHLVALAAIERHESQHLPEMRQVFLQLARSGGGAGAYPLSAATTSDSLAARLWFEAQYFDAASLISQGRGKTPTKAVLRQARKQGGGIRAADLLARYPALGEWLSTSFADD